MYAARRSHCDMDWRRRDLCVQKERTRMSNEAQEKPVLTITAATEQAIQEGKQSYADVKVRVKELTGSEPSNTVIAQARKKLNSPALRRGRKKKTEASASEKGSSPVASKPVARRSAKKATDSISATELIEFTKAYNSLKSKHGEKFNELVSLAGKL